LTQRSNNNVLPSHNPLCDFNNHHSLLEAKNMKFFSANLETLRELYLNQLRMLLSTEQQIIDALPTMIEKATDVQLKQAFQSHLQETRVHVRRLEEILVKEVRKADPIKCKVMAALVTEADDLVKDATDESVRDAALIAAAQRVEHYEIAAYGTVRHWAQILGRRDEAEMLDTTAKEEGHADHLLTSIAERVNIDAEKAA
jgi:ferritin-like metal-binding protein YciE